MNLRTALVFLPLLFGCATRSAGGVPAIDADALHRPSLVGFSPRTLALEVIDARSPLPESSAKMVAEVTRALDVRLRSAGLRIDPAGTTNKLVLTVTYKDPPMAGFEREDCVWFRGRLTSAAGAWVEGQGIACFEWRHAFGFHVGGDASRAYETGLSNLLESLDLGWASLGSRATK